MPDANEVKFLALLVHRGLVNAADAQRAFEHGDPAQFLISAGIVSEAQWAQWEETDAGARPVLTRYELGEMLGEGGQARVFLATDRQSGDTVALKILRPEFSHQKKTVEQFVAESKLLMELDCEHIVRGYRLAREGESFFCAMEVIEGECLQDRLGDGANPLDEKSALEVVVQVADALAYLHARGLVHRDVKPGNILLAEDGRAVLIDLGFATGGDADDGESTAGTVHYISPEQARGQGQLDARADIYSLGATLYHLVTGSLPFSGEDNHEVMAKQVLESLSGERIRDLGLSPQVQYFIEKMMAKEKEIRFQDPGELTSEIRAYLQQNARDSEPEKEPGNFRRARAGRSARPTRGASSRRRRRR